MLIALETLFFYSFYTREIAWYPPQAYDQAAYLSDTYQLQERVFSNGPRELWREFWSKHHAGTVAFPIEGAFAGLVLGGTRLPQLSVLFVAFCALQVVAFKMARAVWVNRAYSYMVVGLILAQSTAWYWAGGLFDFRMDFLAYCLYGIWACAVLRSRLFLDRRWAIGCGLIAILLVLNRFLSIIYVLGVLIGFAGVCAVVWLLQRDHADLSRRMRKRLSNLGLSLGLVVIIIVPILLINWAAIYEKYVVAQFFYEKDVRAQEFGVFDLSGHLLYYPKSILKDHLGPTFLGASALVIVSALIGAALAASRRGSRKMPVMETAPRPDETFMLEIIFLLGAIACPILVLTMDVSKSPVIGGIVGVPAALLITSFAASFRKSESPISQNIVFACSLVVFAIGLDNQFRHANRHTPEHAQRRDLNRLAELDKWFIDYSSARAWRQPTISCDIISGWLNAGAIAVSGYEQTGEFINFRQMLGNGIMGVDKPEALSMLAQSDFLILTTMKKAGVYPFYEHIAQYWGDLKAWADKNMLVARTEPFDAFTATVYVRPNATVFGLSGGWITSAGLSLEVPHAVLQQFPKLRLSGPAYYTWLSKIPTVSATIDAVDGVRTVPAWLRRIDNSYEIMVDTSSAELSPSDLVRVHLSFDTFFVLKNLHVNDDSRELVVKAPTVVQLLR